LIRLNIKVKPYSKTQKVVRNENGEIVVHVKAPPTEGKANRAVIEVLSEYLNVPKSSIKIISGYKSRNKVIEIQ